MSTKKDNEDEVELGSLLMIIEKIIKRCYGVLKITTNKIFHLVILFILFIKKHFIYILVMGVLGGILGFIKPLIKTLIKSPNKELVFGADMIVQPNFGSTQQVYSVIKSYNTLVVEKEFKTLSTKLGITTEEASTIKSFSINPIADKRDFLLAYDKLITDIVDTSRVVEYFLEDFEKEVTANDYQQHRIFIISSNKTLFAKLNDKLLTEVVNNSHLQKIKTISDYDIFVRDSLLKASMVDPNIILKQSQNTTTAQIDFSTNQQNETKKLVATNLDIINYIKYLNKRKAKNIDIVAVVSSFQLIGAEIDKKKDLTPIKYAIISALLMILFLGLKRFNIYLNQYDKK